MQSDTVKTAINRAWELAGQLQSDLDQGHITEEEWYRKNDDYFTAVYLFRSNPRGQSGHSGDEAAYRYTQGMVLASIHKTGSFIDVGCANGHLIEKLADWLQETGLEVEFYGLDISEGLIDLAKTRLPKWADRSSAETLFIGSRLDPSPLSVSRSSSTYRGTTAGASLLICTRIA